MLNKAIIMNKIYFLLIVINGFVNKVQKYKKKLELPKKKKLLKNGSPDNKS